MHWFCVRKTCGRERRARSPLSDFKMPVLNGGDPTGEVATWCLWAFSALFLALVAVMIWVCFYKPPRQGPLDYLPISEGQRGEAGQTEASESEKGDQDVDPAWGTVPRTVQRERSRTETSDHRTLRREISESFSDISFMPKRIDPDTARREVQRGFRTKVYIVLLLQLAFTWGVCLLCMKATGLQAFLLDDSNGVPNAACVIWGCFILAVVVLIALHFLKNRYRGMAGYSESLRSAWLSWSA